jgi:hypothetical protein
VAAVAREHRDARRLGPWARVAIATAAVLVVGAPRVFGRTWVEQVNPVLVVELEGRDVEWEWIDVHQSMQLAEGDPRWPVRGGALGEGALLSQNGSRFVPGVALSLLRPWTGSLVSAANVATIGLWVAAALATAALCAAVLRPGRVGPPGPAASTVAPAVAGALAVVSPGFAAFAGNIDAHQFGYAAAPLGLLLLERARITGHAERSTRAGRSEIDELPSGSRHSAERLGACIGCGVFVANATLELGPPLLLMVWLVYVLPVLRSGLARAGWELRFAACAVAAYACLHVAWWAVLHAATSGRIVAYNSWTTLIAETAGRAMASGEVAANAVLDVLHAAGPALTPPVLVAGAAGLALLPARARWWALAWTALIAGAVMLTRPLPRTLYLCYPAWYVAAGWGAAVAGERLSRWRPPASRRCAATERLVPWLPGIGLVLLTTAFTLADLAGGLFLARAWWR